MCFLFFPMKITQWTLVFISHAWVNESWESWKWIALRILENGTNRCKRHTRAGSGCLFSWKWPFTNRFDLCGVPFSSKRPSAAISRTRAPHLNIIKTKAIRFAKRIMKYRTNSCDEDEWSPSRGNGIVFKNRPDPISSGTRASVGYSSSGCRHSKACSPTFHSGRGLPCCGIHTYCHQLIQ